MPCDKFNDNLYHEQLWTITPREQESMQSPHTHKQTQSTTYTGDVVLEADTFMTQTLASVYWSRDVWQGSGGSPWDMSYCSPPPL